MTKIEWIGPSGFTPGIGHTYEGSQHEVDENFAQKLISEGIAKRVNEKSNKSDKTKGEK